MTLKSGLEARQGHCKCQHSIERIRLLLTFYSIWLYLVSFLRYSMPKNAVTLKTGLGVSQGNCHRLIECIRLPIDVLSINQSINQSDL